MSSPARHTRQFYIEIHTVFATCIIKPIGSLETRMHSYKRKFSWWSQVSSRFCVPFHFDKSIPHFHIASFQLIHFCLSFLLLVLSPLQLGSEQIQIYLMSIQYSTGVFVTIVIIPSFISVCDGLRPWLPLLLFKVFICAFFASLHLRAVEFFNWFSFLLLRILNFLFFSFLFAHRSVCSQSLHLFTKCDLVMRIWKQSQMFFLAKSQKEAKTRQIKPHELNEKSNEQSEVKDELWTEKRMQQDDKT